LTPTRGEERLSINQGESSTEDLKETIHQRLHNPKPEGWGDIVPVINVELEHTSAATRRWKYQQHE